MQKPPTTNRQENKATRLKYYKFDLGFRTKIFYARRNKRETYKKAPLNIQKNPQNKDFFEKSKGNLYCPILN